MIFSRYVITRHLSRNVRTLMAARISISEFDHRMREVLDRVAYQSESLILERNGREIACLESVGPRPGVTAQEVAEKLRHLEFPEGFADDLEAAQASIPPRGARMARLADISTLNGMER